MTTFNDLVDRFKSVVTVLEIPLYENTGFYGAFRQAENGLPYIFIEHNQPEIDKKVVLMEEFKHMMTSYGVILNSDDSDDVKQENKARSLAYKELITMDDLFEWYQKGDTTEFELAEDLDLPQEFVHNAIQYFKTSYDQPIQLDNGYIATINDTIQFYKVDPHMKVSD